MLAVQPNKELWSRVNAVILGANAAEVVITFVSALCAMLVQSGVCVDERHARVHLAAILLSPDTSPTPGSLLPDLPREIARLAHDG